MTSTTDLLEQVIKTSSLRPRTKEMYLMGVREFVRHGGVWAAATVSAFYRHLLATMQPQSANVLMAGLRFASKEIAKRLGDPTQDFARDVVLTPLARRRKNKRTLTDEDIAALLAVCQTPAPRDLRDRALISLAVFDGLQRHSLQRLQLEDVDVNNNSVRVTVRTGKQRFIKLTPQSTAALQDLLAWMRSIGMTTGFVFRSFSREHVDGSMTVANSITDDGIAKAIKTRAQQAGIVDFNSRLLVNTWTKRQT